MEKIFVVKRVAEKLWATENAIDGALGQASMLMADLVTARQELNLAASVGHESASKIVEAMTALTEARRAAFEAHQALDEVRMRIGVRIKMDAVKFPFVQADEPAEAQEGRRAS